MKSPLRLLPPAAFALLCCAAHSQEAARTYLSKAEVEKTVVGKSMTYKELTSGTLRKWDIRSDGRLYYNDLSNAAKSWNGSGTWELKDDGAICVHWSRAWQGPDFCNYFFQDGDTLVRTGTNTVTAKVIARIEKLE
jgi:hypothetical protein